MSSAAGSVDPTFVTQLRAAMGYEGVVDDAERLQRYNTSPWGGATGQASVVVRPADAAAVAACVRLCAASRIGVVPFGGGTGFLGGQLASSGERQLVISLERLTRIRMLDKANGSVVAEAGVTLDGLDAAVAATDPRLPLAFGASGTAQLGGALSTNAGGMNALRYGTARDLCLGLEVVLPSGEVLDLLRSVRKDNAGYALRHLFIGAEGTLGLVTAAALRLVPRPAAVATAVAACPGVAEAVAVMQLLRARSDQRLSVCELMTQGVVALAAALVPSCPVLFGTPHPVLLLLELEGADQTDLATQLESALGEALAGGLLNDALLAASEAQRRTFWRLRDALPDANGRAGWVASYDVCVPISAIATYLEQLQAGPAGAYGLSVFGHLGDGNLHITLTRRPLGGPANDGVGIVDDAVLGPVTALGGSVSAEHGIGQDKVSLLERTAAPGALALMRAVKSALDPDGIMNPGKVLAAGPAGTAAALHTTTRTPDA